MNELTGTNPSEETLRHQLEIQWKDHFQTRRQTWKALQINALLLLALIIAAFNSTDPWLLISLGIVYIISALAGVSVTIHHRKVEIQKFQFIYMLEEKLLLHQSGYMSGIVKPSEFKWKNIFNLKRLSTPTFILMMHILLFIFAFIYIILRISENFNSVQP
jgi:disulfide bond formation protein DsbB